MKITDIMLFGDAVNGSNSGGGIPVVGMTDKLRYEIYVLHGTAEEIMKQYPVDEIASGLCGRTMVKLSAAARFSMNPLMIARYNSNASRNIIKTFSFFDESVQLIKFGTTQLHCAVNLESEEMDVWFATLNGNIPFETEEGVENVLKQGSYINIECMQEKGDYLIVAFS